MGGPLLGLLFHWIGGLASASFYIPYRRVRGWSWETYWLVGGVFSWIIAPISFALLLVPDLPGILAGSDPNVLLGTWFFGVLWGVGGLTFGLTMRYLGIALGMAVALGYCAAFGTLVPPLVEGRLGSIASSLSGQIVLCGVVICVLGIAVSGLAGMSKERELSEEQKKAAVKEFRFGLGMLTATFSGVMSACFSFGLAFGKPIAARAHQSLLTHGGADLWQDLPVLIVVMFGGFTTNFVWCLILNIKNRSGHEYVSSGPHIPLASTDLRNGRGAIPEQCPDPGMRPGAEISASEGVAPYDAIALPGCTAAPVPPRVPLLANYAFSALAGLTWYLQFFFYSMGTTRMGAYEFSSWTLHMASIIIFSTLWGVILQEWKGSSLRTHAFVGGGLALLVLSTLIVGYGNMLGTPAPH